jgi:hypothetical protein
MEKIARGNLIILWFGHRAPGEVVYLAKNSSVVSIVYQIKIWAATKHFRDSGSILARMKWIGTEEAP